MNCYIMDSNLGCEFECSYLNFHSPISYLWDLNALEIF